MSQEPKTKRTDSDPRAFLDSITDGQQKTDSLRLLEMMEEISGEPAVMWGDSIIGFGSYVYRYASGRSGTWMRIGFSPRSRNISLYIMDGCLSYSADGESDELPGTHEAFPPVAEGISAVIIRALASGPQRPPR